MSQFKQIIAGIALVVTASSAQAQDTQVVELYEVLRLDDMVEIVRLEGIDSAEELAADLFPDRSGERWSGIVDAIYNADQMRTQALANLSDELEGKNVDEMLSFYTSDPGSGIIDLEVSARQALLNDEIEEGSKQAAATAMRNDTDRYQMVERFVQANDLLETNVAGALNSSYAFFIGMLDGGAFGDELSEDQVLTNVWAQEPDIRASTTEWLYSYLLMAYQPLKDADLEAYIAFSETEAGRDMNSAVFAAFDGMFDGISRNLGLASAKMMEGQDL